MIEMLSSEQTEQEEQHALVSATTWHKRFGHANGRKLGNMAKKNRVSGMRVTAEDGKSRTFCTGDDFWRDEREASIIRAVG